MAATGRRAIICTELGAKFKRARWSIGVAQQWDESGGYCLWNYCWSGVIFQRFLSQRCLDAFRVACWRARRNIVASTIYSCRALLRDLGLWRPETAASVVDSSSQHTVIELTDEDI